MKLISKIRSTKLGALWTIFLALFLSFELGLFSLGYFYYSVIANSFEARYSPSQVVSVTHESGSDSFQWTNINKTLTVETGSKNMEGRGILVFDSEDFYNNESSEKNLLEEPTIDEKYDINSNEDQPVVEDDTVEAEEEQPPEEEIDPETETKEENFEINEDSVSQDEGSDKDFQKDNSSEPVFEEVEQSAPEDILEPEEKPEIADEEDLKDSSEDKLQSFSNTSTYELLESDEANVFDDFLFAPILDFAGFQTDARIPTTTNYQIEGASVQIFHSILGDISASLTLSYSVDGVTWNDMGDFVLTPASEKGYLETDLPLVNTSEVENLRIRLGYSVEESDWDEKELIFLDGLYIDVTYKQEVEEDRLEQGEDNPDPDVTEIENISYANDYLELLLGKENEEQISLIYKKFQEEQPLELSWKNTNPEFTLEWDGEKATYKNVFSNTDFEYQFIEKGIKEKIILKDSGHPESFLYKLNLSQYDYRLTNPSQIDIYKKGFKGNKLFKLFTITAPWMEDANGSRSEDLVFEVDRDSVILAPSVEFLATATYPVVIDPTVEIMVLNIYSHPQTGDNWNVDFVTVGQSDLTITPADQTSIDDMDFVKLTCDREVLEPEILSDDVIYYPDWECDGVGRVSHLINMEGHHHLVFQFGEERADAYNGTDEWDGGGDGSTWSDDANWVDNSAPGAGDDVVIDEAVTVNITAATTVQSVTLGVSGGGTASILNFDYDAIGGLPLTITGDLIVYADASITHTVGADNTVNGAVNISVGNDMTLTGDIDVDAKGYQIGPGTGADEDATGGSYGGIGANRNYYGGGYPPLPSQKNPYGSMIEPIDLGSGGAKSKWGCATRTFGGGAVKINVTGTLTFNGNITADGNSVGGSCHKPGGGSGGSIYLTAGTLVGSGNIGANGGNGSTYSQNSSGGGSGGRVAIYYNTDSSSITYTAYGGSTPDNFWPIYYAGSGTIYKKSTSQSYGDLILDNNEQAGSDERYLGLTPIGLISSDILEFDSIIATSSAHFYLSSSTASTLSASTSVLTIAGGAMYDAVSTSTLTYNSLDWTGGFLKDTGGTFEILNQNQDLTIPTNSKLIFNVATSSSSVSRTYNNLNINGSLLHSFNEGVTTASTSLYKINWQIDGDLTIASGGSIDVNYRGYPEGEGHGSPEDNTDPAGASYGGLGGDGAVGVATSTYGSNTAPTHLGSGGGHDTSYASNRQTSGSGGGAVILNVTGAAIINGDINADGQGWRFHTDASGGSGGSIYLTTVGLEGSGNLTANGGDADISYDAGGGGGGRIAVIYGTDASSISLSVDGGVADVNAGAVGTTYYVASNSNPDSPSSFGPTSYVNGSWSTDNTPTLTFTLADDDGSDTVKYHILIDDSSDFSSAVVDYSSALQSQGAASFTVGQAEGSGSYTIGSEGQVLSDSSEYYWRVSAMDNSSAVSATTTANSGSIAFKIDTTDPDPGTFSVSSTASTTLTASVSGASDATSGLSATPYIYENSTDNSFNGPTVDALWAETGLIPNTQYTYSVSATDAAGNIATSSTVSAYTLAAVPTSTTAIADSGTQITFSWDANNNPAGTEYYPVETTASTSPGWITTTSYVFTGLTCGTTYFFKVEARNVDNATTTSITAISADTDTCPVAPTSSEDEGGGGPSSGKRNIIPKPPEEGDFEVIINSGSETSFSRNVILNFSVGNDTTHMAIANDASFAGSGIVPFSQNYSWDLCSVSGGIIKLSNSACVDKEHTVYARFYNAAGNASETVFDSINLVTGEEEEEVTDKIIVRLGGEAYNGAPSYRIYIDGRLVKSDIVPNSRDTAIVGKYDQLGEFNGDVDNNQVDWTDIEIPWNYEQAGYPEKIIVQYVNDYFFGGAKDRNLLIDYVVLKDIKIEAEGPFSSYPQGKWKNHNKKGAETMLWNGQMIFSVSGALGYVPKEQEPATDPGSIVVRLGGEAYNGDPHYVILVNGQAVSSGYVTTARNTTKNSDFYPRGKEFKGDILNESVDWMDVLVPWDYAKGVPEKVVVKFDNDAYGGSGQGDRNMFVDYIQLRNVVVEAEGEHALYSKSGYNAGTEVMLWDGNLTFFVQQAVNQGRGIKDPVSPSDGGEEDAGKDQEQEDQGVSAAEDNGNIKDLVQDEDFSVGESISAATNKAGKILKNSVSSVRDFVVAVGSKTVAEPSNRISNNLSTFSRSILEKIDVSEGAVTVTATAAAVAVAPLTIAVEHLVLTVGNLGAVGGFSDLWLIILRLFSSLMLFVGIKKPRRYWGTVYDTKTKMPLDPVLVKLIDVETGKTVETAITDLSGRFGFLPLAGKFVVTAAKNHYRFPSKNITSGKDGIYNNLYHGEEFELFDKADLVAPNIPMDPLAVDYNQLVKPKYFNYHPKREKIINTITTTLFWLGMAFVVFNLVTSFTGLNTALVIFYVALMMFRIKYPKKQLWGTLSVTDKNIAYKTLTVEISPAKIPQAKLGIAKVSEYGRFFLKVDRPGTYILTINQMVEGETKEIDKMEVVVGKDLVVNHDIEI